MSSNFLLHDAGVSSHSLSLKVGVIIADLLMNASDVCTSSILALGHFSLGKSHSSLLPLLEFLPHQVQWLRLVSESLDVSSSPDSSKEAQCSAFLPTHLRLGIV